MRQINGDPTEEKRYSTDKTEEVLGDSTNSNFLPHPWDSLFQLSDYKFSFWRICENVLKRQAILDE